LGNPALPKIISKMSSSTENEAPSKENEEQNQGHENAAKDERPPSIVYGPSTPVPLTMTFSELLDYNAEVRGERPAIISDPQNLTMSFKQLRERSIKLARAMSKDGIGKGDLVAISLGSRVEYFETYFACARLGAALVLLNYAYTESEMLALLKDVRK
jgi:non-ribosomal peptide synthetase component F